MTDLIRPRVKYVIGPDGSPLTIADLPPSNTRRWVIRRKAEVVAAVRGGLLSLDEACQRYKRYGLDETPGLPGVLSFRACPIVECELNGAVQGRLGAMRLVSGHRQPIKGDHR
jgi:hypothetical protein